MIDYSTNPPTWAGTNRPVKNAVQAAIKKGLIKEWTEQDERSGYDFRAALIAWGESLKPGDIFTREDWMRYAMSQSGGSGMDQLQAIDAWKSLAGRIKKRAHRQFVAGPGLYKVWEKV
jgi:hypothetical protein